ncbi:hypothetical protein BC629DRAFT_1455850 [Irpex lacteus]|nr:hypothetical protein BC629DRAFT_1455850 [Irpex lacteus]
MPRSEVLGRWLAEVRGWIVDRHKLLQHLIRRYIGNSATPPEEEGEDNFAKFSGFVPVTSEVAGKKKTRTYLAKSQQCPSTISLSTRSRRHLSTLSTAQARITLGVFDPIKEEEQVTAASILAANRLDTEARQCIDNRWTIKCSCGYDHTVVGSKKRLAAVPFTGCLAHAEVVCEVQTHHVLLIRGYFEHNEGCLTAEYTRAPTLPVHPIVYQHALEQLKKGMTWKQVKDSNHSMYTARTYPDMPRDLGSSRYRWILHTTDHRSLYRQFSRMKGTDVIQDNHMNAHDLESMDLDEDDNDDKRVLETLQSEHSTATVTENELDSPSMTAAMSETSSDFSGDKSELSLRLSELDEIMKQPANNQTVSHRASAGTIGRAAEARRFRAVS